MIGLIFLYLIVTFLSTLVLFIRTFTSVFYFISTFLMDIVDMPCAIPTLSSKRGLTTMGLPHLQPHHPCLGLFIALLAFVKRLKVETLVAFASNYSNMVGP